ncbi:MAG TPA: GNAT family N-acetyltransferase, partial [Thermoanaerobaculia bacterium]
MLREVAPERRRELAPLFGFHPPPLRAVLAAVLEGSVGRAWCPARRLPERTPGSARSTRAAASYAVGGGGVDVAIATRAAFRGRGFAAAASARLLLEAIARGLEPRWNASNPVSQRLAARRG